MASRSLQMAPCLPPVVSMELSVECSFILAAGMGPSDHMISVSIRCIQITMVPLSQILGLRWWGGILPGRLCSDVAGNVLG